MGAKAAVPQAAKIGDAAVQAKTGRTWSEWFAVLDLEGARNRDHKTIATLLAKQHGLPGWWAQMVTVGYEQARGLRAQHQKPGGYEISRSLTVPVSVETLFNAWLDDRTRRDWLEHSRFVIRKSSPSKSLRITWVDGETNLDVNFYPKGKDKSQVSVQHSKLPDAKHAARMKAYWAEQLQRLEKILAPWKAPAIAPSHRAAGRRS